MAYRLFGCAVALALAAQTGFAAAAELKVLSDSELLVRQMQGRYKVKSPGLIDLYDRARALVRKLDHFSIDHVLRHFNKEADALVNQVLDSRGRGAR